MPTRAATAREAALLKSSLEQDSMGPPTTDGTPNTTENVGSKGKEGRGSSRKRIGFGQETVATSGNAAHEADNGTLGEDNQAVRQTSPINTGEKERRNTGEDTAPGTSTSQRASVTVPNRRKRKSEPTNKSAVSSNTTEPVKGGWDELPHNMGKTVAGTKIYQNSSKADPGSFISPPMKRARKAASIKTEDHVERNETRKSLDGSDALHENEEAKRPFTKRTAHGRAKNAQPVTPESSDHVDPDPITEELNKDLKEEYGEDTKKSGLGKHADENDEKSKKKRPSRAKKLDISKDVQQKVGELLDAVEKPAKKIKKGKTNPYGLTPGQSPFPDFAMPTVEACKNVEDALSEVHGKVEAPKEIPAPSLEVTGCGEVPSVLDALVRTRLSASTTSQNAKYAFTGLVARYGVLEDGVGAGSVNWNKVRESDVLDIEKAIKKGGLAKTKSVSIKKILEMVYDQNLARRDAFIKEKEGRIAPNVVGVEKMTQSQKDMEIEVANEKRLSLDFMHGLTADQAMMEFVKYPGIGVKTASCVILFCLQRPSFAVDTHVWRFCKWLKWVPEGATRDQTFSHCEVRIPNEMKYSLHQLFIRHGKTCGRCRAITGEGSEGWESTLCPLENLVERTGKKKGTGPPNTPVINKKANRRKKVKKEEDDEDDEDLEMSDLSDIEEQVLDDDSESAGVGREQLSSEEEE